MDDSDLQQAIDTIEYAYRYVSDDEEKVLRQAVEILTEIDLHKCFCPMCR